ncbi:flagellar biosynthetic protein FliR [Magnetospirillum molischianum]|uniref:Flagellar biosynthetic protein FliR n=1 Tax=Magnetospirillum molischianum DSM 120 TaxID=1150626 RepID=H8FMR8_MAGML|nr:flagellar biosynthetic protein FliR [Magnetospirillum molischianum]CCG39656.1 Flagellar biosynthetic protein fliR [Magnetospirillum molischianum DSM 120]
MLTELLQLDVYRFFLIFARIGAAMFMFPGLGGPLVSSRIRLLLALSISFLMLPTLGPTLPSTPPTPGSMLALLGGEVMIGVFIGSVVTFVMGTLNLAGSMIGYMTGLTNAFSFDPISQQQSQLLTGFLSNVGMLAVFSTDLHHLMFRAVIESYDLFQPGQTLPLGDFSETLSHLLTETFRIGLQFSAPLIVFGLVFYTGLGLLSRLVPQMQVFFVAMPIQMLIGMAVFMASLSTVIALFLRLFENTLIPYLPPG